MVKNRIYNEVCKDDDNNSSKKRKTISRNSLISNNLKFSNTEIPSVIDGSYIQKRINKTEIPNIHNNKNPNFETHLNNQNNFNFNYNKEISVNSKFNISETNSESNYNNNGFFDYNQFKLTWHDSLKLIIPIGIVGIGYWIYKHHGQDILSFLLRNSDMLNRTLSSTIVANHGIQFSVLVLCIGCISGIIFYLKDQHERQEKLVITTSEEIYENVLSELKELYDQGYEDPDIDVEKYIEYYKENVNKEINQTKLIKKVLKNIDKRIESQNSELLKINIYLDGILRSFWKLKFIDRSCI